MYVCVWIEGGGVPEEKAGICTSLGGMSILFVFNSFIFKFTSFFFFLIYLFMAVLGLRFCVRAFCSRGEWGPLFIAVHGPLTIAASLVVEHRLQTRRLSNYGSRA